MVRTTSNFEFGAMQKRVNVVDLEKYCKINTYEYYHLLVKISFDTAENPKFG